MAKTKARTTRARQATRKTVARAKKPEAPKRPRPRQQDLPGTEDRTIQALEEAAGAYADIRDQRIALNADEAKLKGTLLQLMKRHGKQVYHRDGITIQIVQEEETVKVRIKKASDEDEDGDAPAFGGGEFAADRAAAVNDDDDAEANA
jgi:hypothetical protein